MRKYRAWVVVDAGDFAIMRQMVRHIAGAAAKSSTFRAWPPPFDPNSASRYFKSPRAPGKPGVPVFFQNRQSGCSHSIPSLFSLIDHGFGGLTRIQKNPLGIASLTAYS